MDAGDVHGLLSIQRRLQLFQNPGQAGLARTRGTHQQEMMPPHSSQDGRLAHLGLPFQACQQILGRFRFPSLSSGLGGSAIRWREEQFPTCLPPTDHLAQGIGRHHLNTLDQAGFRLFPNGERYLKPRGELAHLFASRPRALARSVEIAERAAGFRLDELRYQYPDEVCPAGRTPMQHRCWGCTM